MEAVPLRPPAPGLPDPKREYSKGEAVLYCRPGRPPIKATVVQVDRTTVPPQYGVEREGVDGIVFTELDRLRPRQPTHAPVPAASAGQLQFRYVYSPAYRSVQHLFEQCQATHDPNSIARLLQQAPYHVDSLLSMYDLYRHMGENAYAEECLARALYCLEMGWHAAFDVSTANVRMDFELEENRAMFTALFRHTQALSRQGCHRSALEVCKLLLALEPGDPMGALMLLDYLALRAGRHGWLREFTANFEGSRSLALLPNYAYSCALARLRQAQEEAKAGAPAADQPSALELAVQAVLLHPAAVPALLAKLREGGSGREAHWDTLMSRKPFSSAAAGSTSLQHLVNIYAERSGLLWKPPDALQLLRTAACLASELASGATAAAAAEATLRTCGGGDGAVAEADVDAAASAAHGLRAEDWACVRRDAFPEAGENEFRHLRLHDLSDASRLPAHDTSRLPVPTAQAGENEFRHLRLHDFSDAVAQLPRDELNAAMADGGAEGVEDAIADMQEQLMLQQQLAMAGGGGGARGMTDDELRSANPIMMLLRSLMPWVDAGQQPDYGGDRPAGGPGGGAA